MTPEPGINAVPQSCHVVQRHWLVTFRQILESSYVAMKHGARQYSVVCHR